MQVLFWGVEYLASFIECLMCCYFCNTFLAKEEEEDLRLRFVFSSFVAAVIVFCLNRVELFSMVTSMVSIVLLIITQCITYKKRYMLLIGLVGVYVVLMSAIDAIVLFLYGLLSGREIAFLMEDYSSARVMCILLSKSILAIVVISMNKIHADKRIVPLKYLLLVSFCSVCLLISNLILTQFGADKERDELNYGVILFFVASMSIEMIVFWLVLRIAEVYELKKNNMFIEMNNRMLQKELDERENAFSLWRESIHDYHNNIIALSLFAETGDLEKIKEFLKVEKESLSQQLFYIKTGNELVDRIINMKQKQAERQNISFVVDAHVPEKLTIDDMDMASVLGNLLDNAIEAEQKEENPYIEVVMKQEKEVFNINIRNKCTANVSAEHLKTSKKDAQFHGIGLSSVRRTVKKYRGEMHVEILEGEFIANLVIPNTVTTTK